MRVNNEAKMTKRHNLKGLVIAEPWISHILSGRKTWQMCPKISKHRGPMALVRKGSGSVVGIADISSNAYPLSMRRNTSRPKHCTAFLRLSRDAPPTGGP